METLFLVLHPAQRASAKTSDKIIPSVFLACHLDIESAECIQITPQLP